MLRVRDLTMLQAHNSRERELDDWIQLLAAADPRLRLKNVVQPTGSLMSVMEVTYDDDDINQKGGGTGVVGQGNHHQVDEEEEEEKTVGPSSKRIKIGP